MQFVVTYANPATGQPDSRVTMAAADIDVAAQRAVANCGDGSYVVRVEQAEVFTGVEVELTYDPSPDYIALGYEIGSADLPHGRKLHVQAAGSSIYFRLSDRVGYVKASLNDLATRAATILTGDES